MKSKPTLSLGFHYHIPAMRIQQQLRMPGYLGVFVDSIAEQCKAVTCFLHSPLPHEIKILDYSIHSPNVEWVDLGPHFSIPKRLLSSTRVSHKLRGWEDYLDVLLMRAPTPLLPIVNKAIGQTPVALLLVGDNLLGVDEMKQPLLRKEVIRLFWRWNKSQQTRVAQRSLTFVNSGKLYKELSGQVPHLVQVRTTTLGENDFFERQDTCGVSPYHLLYTGRIDRAKGMLDMIEALALLIKQGEDVILDIVGLPASGDTILKEIYELAQTKGVIDRVRYHGFKSLGPELFAYYRMADLYIIASRSSFEGFPRSIWEAMAHSLPVVATRVGSIPDFVEGIAELVEPCQPKALAAGITRVLHSPSARKAMIIHGIQQARNNTLEVQASKMVDKINNWLKNER